MKPMNRRIAVISLSALLISSAGAALAFGGPKDHHGGCDRNGGHDTPMSAISQLEDLSAEQRDQLLEIRKSARKAMRDLRDEMHDNRVALHDAMADNADLETIRKLADKQGEQVARMIVWRAEIRNKVSGVLTEEQRIQLDSMRMPGGDFLPQRNHMGF
jgi:Spy/CpxP family protein refolding chaperone